MGDHDFVVGNAEAAQIICGGTNGSLSNLQHWRKRYPILDQLSDGEGRHRRWRRSDLMQFLIDLPKHRAARRQQLAARPAAQVQP